MQITGRPKWRLACNIQLLPILYPEHIVAGRERGYPIAYTDSAEFHVNRGPHVLGRDVAYQGVGIHFDSILTPPFLCILTYLRPDRRRIRPNPTYPFILACHRQDGGEAYGLDTLLGAYELALWQTERVALYNTPPVFTNRLTI